VKPNSAEHDGPFEPGRIEIEANGESMPKHFDFVLLGGGPAGVSAAERGVGAQIGSVRLG